MYIDINTIVNTELRTMKDVYEAIESAIINGAKVGKLNAVKAIDEGSGSLFERSTSGGIVYHIRRNENGKRVSHKLGKADDAAVIEIKQRVFNNEILKRLKKNIKLLKRIEGKFLPYDPDSIDRELKEVYRDRTGLVNKAPGIVDLDEWMKIDKRNGYPLPKDCNIAADGMKTRSKSELIIYGILKGYALVIKHDMEIKLKDDTGQTVTVCPDFVILCSDGSLIIIEHLGMLDNGEYLQNALRRIHLYQINGYRLNENLFLTADYAPGKINAQVIDEMVRKMILPRVH